MLHDKRVYDVKMKGIGFRSQNVQSLFSQFKAMEKHPWIVSVEVGIYFGHPIFLGKFSFPWRTP